MIVAEDLAKHFSDSKRGIVRAVDGVSFGAHPGEIFGLLGANGAGKTTLLRLLSTVIKPTHGYATIGGHDIITQPDAVRKSIGFMSTTTALYSRLTPREMLNYMGRLYGLRGRGLKSRIAETIEMLEIEEFADRLCDKLSTGQKQRVSLARTILHEPPVLFFDEPTAGLDVIASKTIMEFIESCKSHGKTVVFSTHIMSEAERVCDRICVIHDGKVRAIGTFDDLKRQTGEERLEKVFLALTDTAETAA
jgi:sodium transport system ATP-binding protein